MAHEAEGGPRGRFPTTHWSVVRAAGSRDAPDAREALAYLCTAYWYPLYGFVRRSGYSAEDARDVVQGFFTRFLQKDYLSGLQPEAGRFRSYLLAAMRNFITNERERVHALKRGGGIPDVSLDLDFEEGERRHSTEPSTEVNPELLYHRRWALVLLGTVVERLRRDYGSAGRGEVFEVLEGFLPGAAQGASYREAAERLGISLDAAKVAIHRMRRRYGDLLRAEVAGTVSAPRDIDDEIRFLLDALAGPT